MTPTPHDALFKAAFERPEHAGQMFRAVLPKPIVDVIEWDTIVMEPGSFIDPALGGHHSDLLFSVELAGETALLYLLLEHQSSNDRRMPFRMLVYLVEIWKRYAKDNPGAPLPLIIPMVVSHAPGGWTAPVAFHELFEPHPSSIPGIAEFIPQFSFQLEDLAHLSNEDLKARALAAFPKLALWALRDARDIERLLANLGQIAAVAAEASQTPSGMDALAQVFRYIALVSKELNIDDFRGKIREQLPDAEDSVMTIYEQALAEGRAQGREEGREQGRIDILVKLLTLKFGEVSSEDQARLGSATAEQLHRYAERVLTAESLAAVFADQSTGG